MFIKFSAALFFVLNTLAIPSLAQLKVFSKYEMTTGKYWFHQKGEKYKKGNVEVSGDSVAIYSIDDTPITPARDKDQYFVQPNIDIDIFYTLVKYRPAEASLPRQLINSFNASIFLGYRLERFHLKIKKRHSGSERMIFHRSIGLGMFGGIGSASIAPWTTNYQTNDEYSGFVLSRGVILLGGVDSVTFGFALGIDALTDRDKHIWIYQNRPWYGIVLGLNIN